MSVLMGIDGQGTEVFHDNGSHGGWTRLFPRFTGRAEPPTGGVGTMMSVSLGVGGEVQLTTSSAFVLVTFHPLHFDPCGPFGAWEHQFCGGWVTGNLEISFN